MPNRALSILLVDSEESIHQAVGTYLQEAGHQVEYARDSAGAMEALARTDYDLLLTSLLVPGLDGRTLLARCQELRPGIPIAVTVPSNRPSLEAAIQAMRAGAMDALIKPIRLLDLDRLLDRTTAVQIQQESAFLRAEGSQGHRLIGTSKAMRRVQEQIAQAVRAKCETILITGETGTGKELVAQEVHATGSTLSDPFIAVSCPTLTETIMASELFGSVRGAFTGAIVDRPGYFEQAQGGSLFLDEIADIPISGQATLLRVLETRTLRRVGGSKLITVDVRVIAATNASLEALMAAGRFRRDLFHRLNLYQIQLPPLRDRREDILPLAEHFLAVYTASRGLSVGGFAPDAQDLLIDQPFPGNVRELRYLVERAVMACSEGRIRATHLTLGLSSSEERPLPTPGTLNGDPTSTDLIRVLDAVRWNRREAARRLGLPYATLRYRMQKLGIG